MAVKYENFLGGFAPEPPYFRADKNIIQSSVVYFKKYIRLNGSLYYLSAY